jgi:hypothetical protein
MTTTRATTQTAGARQGGKAAAAAMARQTRRVPGPVRPPSAVDRLLQLQRTAGNAAVARLLGRLAAQRAPAPAAQQETLSKSPVQAQRQNISPRNDTGLPDGLKSGIEYLSGISVANVKVHYNSSQPAQLNSLAYTQGSDIYIAASQEKHLPHEAWHAVQQARGQVNPTARVGDWLINDNAALEREADVMGERAHLSRPHHELDAQGSSGSVNPARNAPDDKSIQLTTKRKRDDVNSTEGTYAGRENEKKRLGIVTGSRTHESEHIVGFAVAHPNEIRKKSREPEGQMPAYYEVKEYHRGHPGTGSSGRERPADSEEAAEWEKERAERAKKTGWSSSSDYRRDLRTTLTDPVARKEDTSLSNAYQLNQLGYAHLWASADVRPSGDEVDKANDSYNNMVSIDPGLEHSLTGTPVTDYLGPHGQAEAYLTRKIGLSGKWPTQNEIDDARKKFGAF